MRFNLWNFKKNFLKLLLKIILDNISSLFQQRYFNLLLISIELNLEKIEISNHQSSSVSSIWWSIININILQVNSFILRWHHIHQYLRISKHLLVRLRRARLVYHCAHSSHFEVFFCQQTFLVLGFWNLIFQRIFSLLLMF